MSQRNEYAMQTNDRRMNRYAALRLSSEQQASNVTKVSMKS